MRKNNDDFDPNRINRRNILKKFGAAGVGVSAFPMLSQNGSAAISSLDVDISNVWDAIVDVCMDYISVDVFEATDDMSAQEKRDSVRKQLEQQMRNDFTNTGGQDDLTTQAYPNDLPFDFCYWTDFGADGSKICVDAATPNYGYPDCDTMSLPYLHYMNFGLQSFDLSVTRNWNLQWSADVWVGTDPQTDCVYTGMSVVDGSSLNQCARVFCPDDLIDAGASVATIAQSAFETALDAIQDWANKQGLWDWLLYVAAALIAIAIIIAVASSGGSFAFALPALAAL